MAKFKPGQSGNPKGNPPGQNKLTRCLKDLLSVEVTMLIADHRRRRREMTMTNAQAIAQAVMQKARAGSIVAAEFIAERTDGKVKETHQIFTRRDELEKSTPEELKNALLRVLSRIGNAGKQRPSDPGDH